MQMSSISDYVLKLSYSESKLIDFPFFFLASVLVTFENNFQFFHSNQEKQNRTVNLNVTFLNCGKHATINLLLLINMSTHKLICAHTFLTIKKGNFHCQTFWTLSPSIFAPSGWRLACGLFSYFYLALSLPTHQNRWKEEDKKRGGGENRFFFISKIG